MGVMFHGVMMESSTKNERTLADIEETFYKSISANSVFSSVKRSASALEKLTKTTEELAEEMGNLREAFEESSTSSSKVARALNWLTGALVLVGLAQVIVAVIK
jgi:methyl-accepting chemotaxis protein